MTVAQAQIALAPRVVCVMAPANKPATKRVRLACGCVEVVPVLTDVRTLLGCGQCREVRNA